MCTTFANGTLRILSSTIIIIDLIDNTYFILAQFKVQFTTSHISGYHYLCLKIILFTGAIYGLAIYNSIIIYVPFPLVLYKKLLEEAVMLDDLSDLYPTLANSLKSLLDYPDEDVEEVCLYFVSCKLQIEYNLPLF